MISVRWSSALERTFLAYIRTSVAFSMQGVLIAQLFHLYSPESDRRATRFTYATVGVPLSVTFQSCAIVVAILGAARFWRQQMAIARGKVFAGGWELNAIGGLTMSVRTTCYHELVNVVLVSLCADTNLAVQRRYWSCLGCHLRSSSRWRGIRRIDRKSCRSSR